nr:enoyl coenzyme A hydratase [Hymenolepis microstoma]
MSSSRLVQDSPVSPTRVLRRNASDVVPVDTIDVDEEPLQKRIRSSQEPSFSSPRKTVTVTVKDNEVEEFYAPSNTSSNNSTVWNGLNIPEGVSIPDKVMAIIDFLRDRRRRPDENIVISCAEQYLKMSSRESLDVLKGLIESNRIIKIKYPSGYSYRYPINRSSSKKSIPTSSSSNKAPTKSRATTRNSENTKRSNHNGGFISSRNRSSHIFGDAEIKAVHSFAKLISSNKGIVRPLKMTTNGRSPVFDKIESALFNGESISSEKTSVPGASTYDIPPPTPLSLETVEKLLKNLPHLIGAKVNEVDGKASLPPNGRLRSRGNSNANSSIFIFSRPAEGLVQLVIHSSGSRLRNTFSFQVLKELTDALDTFVSDPQIRAILISGAGSVFSSGVDLHSLSKTPIKSSEENNFVDTYVGALRKFLLTLASYPKILIAGVNGPAEGLGMTVLPLFDLVYASDISSFHAAYTTLGQVPEAGASYTLASKLSPPVVNDLLLAGRRLTAREAQECGLISDVLFPKNFAQEVVLRCARIATQSISALMKTKCLTRLWDKERIEFQINAECNQLAEIWKTVEFRVAAANYVNHRMDLFI